MTPTSSAITLHRRPLQRPATAGATMSVAEDYDAFVESNENAYVGIRCDGRIVGRSDRTAFRSRRSRPTARRKRPALRPTTGSTPWRARRSSRSDLTRRRTASAAKEGDGGHADDPARRKKKFDVTVKRASVEVEVVKYSMLDGSIGYIKINNFEANSADRTIEAIDAARAGRQGARVRPAL